MGHAQFTKFSPYMLEIKAALRDMRLGAGFSMHSGAQLLKVSRKQLEDLETVRNYGCHVEAEILGRACQLYNKRFTVFEPSHMSNKGNYYQRPRRRGGQA